MKCLKHFMVGSGRIATFFVALLTFPVWLPVMMLHDAGCNNKKDRWLSERDCF